MTCDECGKTTDNEFRPCAGAVAEERSQNVPEPIDCKGLASCNCCESCRDKCHEDWMKENYKV